MKKRYLIAACLLAFACKSKKSTEMGTASAGVKTEQGALKEGERGLVSDTAVIETNPQPPIIVDGLWPHNERFTGIRETEIEVPNFDCNNCFLQVIQFMAEHPGFREGGFSYHHCAMINITADPALPLDDRWQSSGS